jgi:hypothetical protein
MMTLPELIVEYLDRVGPQTNAKIRAAVATGVDDREFDYVLQRLRKADKIHYVSPTQGWAATRLGTCPMCKGKGTVRL